MFWATLYALVVGLKLKKIGIEHHPLVTLELVKFLAVKTGIEAIETLKNETFKKQIAKLTKSLKGAIPSATIAANTADQDQKDLKYLKTLIKRCLEAVVKNVK